MYSRRLKVEEKENKRKAIGFVFLTIAAILSMFFYGLPLLAKISNFAYDLKKSGELIENSDNTPPPPPRFSNIPVASNNNKLEVKGHTEPAATVVISFNNKTTELLVNSDGEFSHTFSLQEGENILFASARDSAGNESHESEAYIILFDKKTPEIEIIKPQDGDEFYGSKQKQITIEGKTEKNARVQINDRLAIVDSTGAFSQFITLADGENKFTVKAQDQAGNLVEKVITVKFIP